MISRVDKVHSRCIQITHRNSCEIAFSGGFVSRVASQVSQPYWRTNERQIIRNNGDLTVTSRDSSHDPSRRRLYFDGTWRSFM